MNEILSFSGQLPEHFDAAFAEIGPELGFARAGQGGLSVALRQGGCLRAEKRADGVVVTWAEPVQVYRALSLLRQHWAEDAFCIEETPCFETTGMMFDVSRNAVLQPDTLRFFLRKMAMMGLNLGMMYIHIGMDEAHGIGLGAHLRRHGYEDPHTIIRRHLSRVLEITRRHGLSAMMWSDMYFRPDSPTDGYYDSGMPSAEAVAAVPPDVTLVYWDYYHETEQEYTDMLQKHAALPAPTVFAGGIWTWCGPAPDYAKTLAAAVPALTACKKAGVPLVLATAWGDNGAEANLTSALLGMQLYAEFMYTGTYDAGSLARRFACCWGADSLAFLDPSLFYAVPGMRSSALRPVNAAKFLLYQDPLVQLFAADTAGLAMSAHYTELEARYTRYADENPAFEPLFRFYSLLARVLAG